MGPWDVEDRNVISYRYYGGGGRYLLDAKDEMDKMDVKVDNFSCSPTSIYLTNEDIAAH